MLMLMIGFYTLFFCFDITFSLLDACALITLSPLPPMSRIPSRALVRFWTQNADDYKSTIESTLTIFNNTGDD